MDVVDWNQWQPRDIATLCFICRDEQVLLIHKKRGLGAGKINGPGGRLEPGEATRDGAIRECREELLIEPLDPVEYGVLSFQFRDGYSLRCHVFRASEYRGTPTETEEARPIWVAQDAIPYDRMWADDIHWLPMMLDGRYFEGRFLFDDDRMVTCEVRELPAAPVCHPA